MLIKRIKFLLTFVCFFDFVSVFNILGMMRGREYEDLWDSVYAPELKDILDKGTWLTCLYKEKNKTTKFNMIFKDTGRGARKCNLYRCFIDSDGIFIEKIGVSAGKKSGLKLYRCPFWQKEVVKESGAKIYFEWIIKARGQKRVFEFLSHFDCLGVKSKRAAEVSLALVPREYQWEIEQFGKGGSKEYYAKKGGVKKGISVGKSWFGKVEGRILSVQEIRLKIFDSEERRYRLEEMKETPLKFSLYLLKRKLLKLADVLAVED